MKRFVTVLTIAALLLSACTAFTQAEGALNLSDYFTDRDLAGTWQESKASTVDLTGRDGLDITVGGVYVLTGAMQGSVTVNASGGDKVQLVLNGVSITASDAAAIYVKNADKVFITLAEGTENTLAVTFLAEDAEIDAAIFSRDDITLNGSGSLTVNSAGNGIVGKDDLKITGGTYTVTAEGRGIDANDSLRVYDGKITVVSGKDALRAKSDEADKGYVLIADGSFDLTVGGGAANAEAHADDMMPGFGPGGWNRYNTSESDESAASAKGVKASGSITVLSGIFTVDASDDAFHAANLTVDGGVFSLQSGDDAIHADNALTLNGGAFDISAYEGLEATYITVNDGDIRIRASDDGLNSAGGSDESGFWRNDMFASDGSSIVINGGSLYVNADGDGIDSNGDLIVNGGAVVVSGPTNAGNGALDFNGSASVNGGTVLAAGAMGMAETFGASSTQVSFMATLSGNAGTITVTDAGGNTVLTGEVEKAYQCVAVSCPDLQVGETYTVSSDTASVQVAVTDLSTGGAGGFGMPGGPMPGGGRK